ncbi:uncharacterized protein CBO05P1_252 [Clostridium botulinum B str. Osaka05]|uniref:Uncharacterized protein n=1 Tax=Clostridium botulinum B str. Osaka05 TaxID=1407017 RepID=A0A060N3A7_CLOBO|nr:hypothetical protein [Clostridium botulinum]BAO04971.1 uncharacterized protein CBO05P1_252 [Clostridium botulinum B str. Osaka05]
MEVKEYKFKYKNNTYKYWNSSNNASLDHDSKWIKECIKEEIDNGEESGGTVSSGFDEVMWELV